MAEVPENKIDRYPEIVGWLRTAAVQTDNEKKISHKHKSFTFEGLLEDDALTIARDLDGVYDSASLIRSGISELLTRSPNTDDLEIALVNLEVDLLHAVKHWDSTLSMLREKYNWLSPETN